MVATRRTVLVVPIVLVAAMAIAGCTSGKKAAQGPVTITASNQSSKAGSSGASAAGTATSPARASTSARTSTKPAPTLPHCETALPLAAVDRAMGHPVTGSTAFVVNQPDPTIHQLARINCQYGLAPATPPSAGSTRTHAGGTAASSAPGSTASAAAQPVAQVEVSVSLYPSAADAAARVTATSTDWRSHGATPHRVSVGTHAATVLLGYGRPLLVLASGKRTVAVSVRPGAVAAGRVDAALTQIARAALVGAGG